MADAEKDKDPKKPKPAAYLHLRTRAGFEFGEVRFEIWGFAGFRVYKGKGLYKGLRRVRTSFNPNLPKP